MLRCVIDILFFWECHAMENCSGIISLVPCNIKNKCSIPTLWYYKMIPSYDSIKSFHQTISSNNFIKQFHQTISSNNFIKRFRQIISIIWNSICIESWRFWTRSLCALVPPTPILLPLLSVWSFRQNQFICKSIIKKKRIGEVMMWLEKALSHVTLLSVISSNDLIKQFHQMISSNNFHNMIAADMYRELALL